MSVRRIFILERGQHRDISMALKREIKKHDLQIEVVPFNFASKLNSCHAFVIPRGGSADYSEVLWKDGFNQTLLSFARSGKSLLALCGGLIVVAKRFGKGCEGRRSLGLLDVAVDNDALNGTLTVTLADGTEISGNFNSAPVIHNLGEDTISLASLEGKIVGVRENNVFGFSYFDQTGISYLPFLESI